MSNAIVGVGQTTTASVPTWVWVAGAAVVVVGGFAVAAAHADTGRQKRFGNARAWRDTKADAGVPFTGWYVFYSGRGIGDRRSGPFATRQEAKGWMNDEDPPNAYLRHLKYRSRR